LKEWGFKKNLSLDDKKVIYAKQKRRREVEGKETNFYISGMPIAKETIDHFPEREQFKRQRIGEGSWRAGKFLFIQSFSL
jgi:hypothetical protein